MSLAQLGHRFITELAALSGTCRAPQNGLRILMYHAVGGQADNDALGYYSITAERFAQHMEILSQTAGVVVSPVTHSACEADSSNVAITFDDGYSDNRTWAAPVLSHFGLPATFFVAAGLVKLFKTSDGGKEQILRLARPCHRLARSGFFAHAPERGCKCQDRKHNCLK